MKSLKFLLAALLLLPFLACGGGGGEKSPMEGPGQTNPDLTDVETYRADSPYSPVLKGCVTAEAVEESCSLSVLPLIGQDHMNPTVEDIMNRVVVSHAWMGERFQVLLQLHLPPDILSLMQSVTAIVIDDDIRPAYYNTLTGAIYLDPAYLWMSVAEKDTISKTEDYRSSFGQELQFHSLARYVKDNDYAFAYYGLYGTETRPIEELVGPLAKLLYHELAHANDFIPAGEIAFLSPEQSVFEVIQSLEGERISALLSETTPLTSQMMKDLAQVMFHGEPAIEQQKVLTAEEVGLEFADDVANDDYGYASVFEDVAMLFEETMMKYHFGIERDIAYTPVPQTSTPWCDDYVVSWGQRGRLGDPFVKERAQFVAEGILGTGALEVFFAGLEEPMDLVTGQGWCANLDPATVGQAAQPAESLIRSLGPRVNNIRVIEDLRPPH